MATWRSPPRTPRRRATKFTSAKPPSSSASSSSEATRGKASGPLPGGSPRNRFPPDVMWGGGSGPWSGHCCATPPPLGRPPTAKLKSASANGPPRKPAITASIPTTFTPVPATAHQRTGFAVPSPPSLLKRSFSAPLNGWKPTHGSRHATINGTSICSVAYCAASSVGMRGMATPPPTPNINASPIGARARMASAGKTDAGVPRIPCGLRRWRTWCGTNPVNCSTSPS
jgi:hypothetical protein